MSRIPRVPFDKRSKKITKEILENALPQCVTIHPISLLHVSKRLPLGINVLQTATHDGLPQRGIRVYIPPHPLQIDPVLDRQRNLVDQWGR